MLTESFPFVLCETFRQQVLILVLPRDLHFVACCGLVSSSRSVFVGVASFRMISAAAATVNCGDGSSRLGESHDGGWCGRLWKR